MIEHSLAMKKIQSLKEMFILCFQPTRMPYVECDPGTFDDQVHLFGVVEEAEEFAKLYRKMQIPVALMKVPQERAPMVVSSFYSLGINAVVYHENKLVTRLQLQELVKKPKIFEEQENSSKIPLANPSLQLSVIYFMQQMYCKVEQDMEQAREMEDEMIANLVRSKFIVASRAANPKEAFEPENPKQKKVINYIKDQEEQIFLPVFSDVGEFQKFYGEKARGMGMLVLPFQHLKNHVMSDVKAIILNPAGCHLQIEPEQLDRLIKAFPLDEGAK